MRFSYVIFLALTGAIQASDILSPKTAIQKFESQQYSDSFTDMVTLAKKGHTKVSPYLAYLNNTNGFRQNSDIPKFLNLDVKNFSFNNHQFEDAFSRFISVCKAENLLGYKDLYSSLIQISTSKELSRKKKKQIKRFEEDLDRMENQQKPIVTKLWQCELEDKTGKAAYEVAFCSHKNPKLAREYYRKAADSGLREGQYNYALICQKDGGEENLKLAREYYRKAADSGLREGQYNFAFMCQKDGGEENLKIAREYYRKAADSGLREGQYNYALICQKDGGEENLKLAREYFKKAADSGQQDAQINFANMCLDEGDDENLKLAREYYRKVADSGHQDAQHIFALICQKDGGDENHKLAREYYRKAADSGRQDAQYNFALICHNEGGEENLKLAREYYRKAADSGHQDAQYIFALICQKDGGDENHKLAREYYRKAADSGHQDAQFKLAHICREVGGDENLRLAREYFKKAADSSKEHSISQYNFAEMCLHGVGGNRDLKLARKYYQKAAKLNYQKARDKLREMSDFEREETQSKIKEVELSQNQDLEKETPESSNHEPILTKENKEGIKPDFKGGISEENKIFGNGIPDIINQETEIEKPDPSYYPSQSISAIKNKDTRDFVERFFQKGKTVNERDIKKLPDHLTNLGVDVEKTKSGYKSLDTNGGPIFSWHKPHKGNRANLNRGGMKNKFEDCLSQLGYDKDSLNH